MSRLHLFCPENDVALAKDIVNYTPPPSVSQLKISGECLPLWYGDPGDQFVCSGINDNWLTNMQRLFGIAVEPFDYSSFGLVPQPWGWSKASRSDFEYLGYDRDNLPDDNALAAMRRLSHRRTAALLVEALRNKGFAMTQAAVEISTQRELEQYLAQAEDAVFKLPYSSSGRGNVPYNRREYDNKLPQLSAVLARHGSILAEPRHHRRSDFALLYTMDRGHATYRGLSLFRTAKTGIYEGNLLMPQEEISNMLLRECTAVDIVALSQALTAVLEDVVGSTYDGPLGVDFMTLADDDRIALCEMNLRNTMGHICLSLYQRHIRKGMRGTFEILPAAERRPQASVKGARIGDGLFYLNPPGMPFDIRVVLE